MYTGISSQKKHITGVMIGLMQQLSTLAPHPDRPNHRGALFTALPGWCCAPGAYDGIAGSVVLQSMLGLAFTEAAALPSAGATPAPMDTGGFDASLAMNALDAYEIYKTETEGERLHKAAHGQGSLARLAGVSLAKGFNQRSQMSAGLQAFLEDMPARLRIERQLGHCLKMLRALEAMPMAQPAPAYGMAA